MTHRRWLEVRVRATERGRELVPDGLVDLGARGVLEEADGFVAYFEEPENVEDFLADVRARLVEETGEAGLRVSSRWQDHEEWAERWKRGLAPRRITDRLVVHPSWAPPEWTGPDDVVIVLDPGMAFGTAEHGTTRGCLRLLDATVRRGDRVLDVGAGSGILSIACAGLGAEHVLAVEGDPLACEAMTENLRRNAVEDRVEIVERWTDAGELGGMGPFDGVVANIEAGLLTPLLPGLMEAVTTGGWLILSGILGREWDAVVRRLVPGGFVLDSLDADGQWRSGRFVRAGGA